VNRFDRLVAAAAAVILGTCAFAGALHTAPAEAVEGVTVRGSASGGDNAVEATVYVSTSPGRVCNGRVRHDEDTLRLPQLSTDRGGGGRWHWTVGADVRAGLWRVSVSCGLHHGEGAKTTSFLASAGARTGLHPVGLALGEVKAEPWHEEGSGGGQGGGGEENGYPHGQCTWWARKKRPDIPVFPGPSGDAKNWARSARKASPAFKIGETAKPGAIVVFQPGQAEAAQNGHVAYVESVQGHEMMVSEYNFAGKGKYGTRHLPWFGQHLQFIYRRNAPEPEEEGPTPSGAFRREVFRTCLNGSCGLSRRTGPKLSFPAIAPPLPESAAVDIVCQTTGDRVVGYDASSTDVWDRLVDGTYVTDYYVNTLGKNDQFTVPIPNCSQVTTPQVPPPAPEVHIGAPTGEAILTGMTELTATSNQPEVKFEARYSTTDGFAATASLHLIGTDSSPGDGFSVPWNTATIPNQGLGTQSTIEIVVTALDGSGNPTGAQDTRRVAVANPGADGGFAYRAFNTCSEADCHLHLRSGPGFSLYPQVGKVPDGGEVDIACQAHGQPVIGPLGPTEIWDELTDGKWASDYYVDTPVLAAFSPPIPQCGTVPEPPVLEVHLTNPATTKTLTGIVEVTASSNAPGVKFEAFYSTAPGSTAPTWHPIGVDESSVDNYSTNWDTTEVPNQGQPLENTILVRATALDYIGAPTEVVATRRVAVSNESNDGTFHYHVYGSCPNGECEAVKLHSGPGYTSYPVIGTVEENDEVDIVCQIEGQEVAGSRTTKIWDELADGRWISDYYVDTPVSESFSPPIPRC
jgi:surface antigen